MSTEVKHTKEIYLSSGTIQDYAIAENCADDVDARAVGEKLIAHADHLVSLYSSNNMKAFWSPADKIALHVAVENRLLCQLDAGCAILDVDKYDSVYAFLADWTVGWITETKRAKFNASVDAVIQTNPFLSTIVSSLTVITGLLANPNRSEPASADDVQLHQIIDNALAQQAKSGWALARLALVGKIISSHIATNASSSSEGGGGGGGGEVHITSQTKDCGLIENVK